MCPDVKKNFEEECDFVVLIQLYLTEDSNLDEKDTCAYIFEKDDFRFFSKKGCWGAKRGNKTIWNVPIPLSDHIINKFNKSPTKEKNAILYYNNEKYRNLFKKSNENWNKLI